MKKNLIYILIDPFTQENRYVGKSTSGLSRPKQHFKAKELKGTTHKANWVKSVMAKGKLPIIYVIEEFDTKEELEEAEQFWIANFKFLGCNLTNATLGGEGTVGYKHREETIEILKQKASTRDKVNYQNPHNKKRNITINNELYRNCAKCEQNKPISEFSLKIKRKTYQGYCKSCALQYERDYRKEHPIPILSESDYNASRLPGAKAGGEASKRPERRLQASQQHSKAVQGTHTITGEIITFPSALKAKEAGFQNSNLGQAIKFNKPYKGYTWTFI